MFVNFVYYLEEQSYSNTIVELNGQTIGNVEVSISGDDICFNQPSILVMQK